jgi:hypothetical protein
MLTPSDVEKRSRLRVIVGLGVIASLLFVWLYPRPPERLTQGRVEDAGAIEERLSDDIAELPVHADPDATGSSIVPYADSLPPLPPEDLPLAAQLPILLERANRGDPMASCRLAVDVVRCTTHQYVSDFSDQLRNAESISARNLGASSQGGSALGLDAHCAGFNRDGVGNLGELLERNKHQLSIRQKVMLALLQPDGSILSIPREIPRGVIASATTRFVYSQFQADNALAFLQEGAQLRDRLALEGLILVHAPSDIPGFRPGIRLSLPNPKLFVGYSLLLVEVFGADALGPIMSESVANVLRSMDARVVDQMREQARASAVGWKGSARQADQSRAAPGTAEPHSTCEP